MWQKNLLRARVNIFAVSPSPANPKENCRSLLLGAAWFWGAVRISSGEQFTRAPRKLVGCNTPMDYRAPISHLQWFRYIFWVPPEVVFITSWQVRSSSDDNVRHQLVAGLRTFSLWTTFGFPSCRHDPVVCDWVLFWGLLSQSKFFGVIY